MEKTKKILVMEDERPLSRALELKLKHEGYEVNTAPDGEKGVEMLKKEKYSMVLLDLVMPKLNGFKVLEYINDEKIKVPVIILSNLSQKEDEVRAKELGAKGFFIKSNTSIADIVDKVRTFLK